MTPVEFEEQNTVFAKNQPEYLPLPALYSSSSNGEVITCWRLSLRERLKVLFTGRLWSCVMTFRKPLAPMSLSVDKHDFIEN